MKPSSPRNLFVFSVTAILVGVLVLVTDAYRPMGFPCRANFQCDEKINLFCNSTRQCDVKGDIGAPCNLQDGCISMRCSGETSKVCQLQQPIGGPCGANNDCLEGFCNATTTSCEAWKDKEIACVDDFECRSGRCTRNPRRCTFVIYEPAVCGKDNDCYGDRCKKDRGLNRCYARKWNNEFCNDNSDCRSLRCETRNCTEPVWNGDACDEPSDCYSLFCNKDKGECVATQSEAGGNDAEIEENAPGITGSEAQQIASGGGELDVVSDGEGGENFGGNGSSAISFVAKSLRGALVLAVASLTIMLV